MFLAFANLSAQAQDIPTASPSGFQPIKASVISETPSAFTINVKFMANTFADTDAPIFAVYTGSKPDLCGDFRNTELSYKKPSKYERQFDLSKHPDILQAIETYACVIIPNIPAK